MIEWKVLNDEPLPEDDTRGSPRRSRLSWLMAASVLMLSLMVSGGMLWRAAKNNEAHLREDLNRALQQEEQALRFGVAEQARDLSDRSAPEEWKVRYEALFGGAEVAGSTPRILSVEPVGDVMVVTLAHGSTGEAWRSVRSYRLVDQRWRRAPTPPEAWGPTRDYRSENFTLQMSDRDAALIPPEKTLAFLEKFRSSFARAWPPAHAGSISIRLEPRDLAAVRPFDAGRAGGDLLLNSPLLTAPAYYPVFLKSPERGYQYELALAVADTLAGSEPSTAEEASLRSILQTALVRHLVLTDEEQRAFRGTIREIKPEGIEELLDTRTYTFLADYLTASLGPGSLNLFWLGVYNTGQLQVPAIGGQPFERWWKGAGLWLALDETAGPTESDPERQVATVTQVLNRQPYSARVVVHETDAVAQIDLPTLPDGMPESCIAEGSTLSFPVASGTGPVEDGEDARVEQAILPAWFTAPMPSFAELLVAQDEGSATRLLASDRVGRQVEIARLPAAIELVSQPQTHVTAFLWEDECGVTVNRFDPTSGKLERLPVELHGTGHLFWLGELYLVDDRSDGSGAPEWVIRQVREGELGRAVAHPVEQGLTWGRLHGFSPISGARLLQSGNGKSYWLDLPAWFRNEAQVLRPASELPEATMTRLSPDGRWLAYVLPDETGTARRLQIMDLANGASRPIASAGTLEFGELLWDSTDSLLLAASVGTPTEHGFISEILYLTLVQPEQPDGAGATFSTTSRTIYTNGSVQGLRWCTNGRLMYQMDSGDSQSLVEGLSPRPFDLGVHGRVIDCLGRRG